MNLTPMVFTENMAATIDYYTGALGFALTGQMSNDKELYWCALENGSAKMMFTLADGDPGENETVIFYFYPENVDEVRRSILSKGYKASEVVVRFYGMKEFAAKDPDGNMLLFGQPTDEPPTQDFQGYNL